MCSAAVKVNNSSPVELFAEMTFRKRQAGKARTRPHARAARSSSRRFVSRHEIRRCPYVRHEEAASAPVPWSSARTDSAPASKI